MIEYDHKGEQCIYKNIICQEGVCSRCSIMENRKCDTIEDICEKLNIRY